MKFTAVFVIALCVTSTWAIKTKIEEPKDKRETLGGYPSSGHSLQSYQAPSLGHEGASAISVGAGYSIGGAKPSFSYGEPISQHGSEATYQISSEGLPSGGHSAIQLAPITLQAGHGGLASSDLSQLMSQLSHGLNTGAISLPGGHDAVYQFGGQSAHGQGAQELSLPQFTYGAPKYQQYTLGEQSHVATVPSYAAGTKGLGSYSSTGPVLFTPGESQGAGLTYGAPSAGHSFPQASLPLGDSGHSLAGLSLGGSGHSFGGSLKQLSGSYIPPSKTSFKPSAYLGSSVQSEGHGLSSLSGSYGAPSFGSYQSSSGSHGLSLGSSPSLGFGGSLAGFGGGSSKFVAPSYLPPKSEGGFGSLESIGAFSSGGHLAASPPGTTYGIPTGPYSAGNAHTASSSPQYYLSKSPSSNFGHGSSSFKGLASGHSSLSSFSGPKYSFGGHSSSRYGSPKDVQGAYSETSYNTIKYSEELKPRNH